MYINYEYAQTPIFRRKRSSPRLYFTTLSAFCAMKLFQSVAFVFPKTTFCCK